MSEVLSVMPRMSPRRSKQRHMTEEERQAQGRMSPTESRAYLIERGLRSRSNDPRSRAALDLLVETYQGFAWGYRRTKGGPLLQEADASVLRHQPGGGPIIYFTGCPKLNGGNLSLGDLVKNAELIKDGKPPLFAFDWITPAAREKVWPLIELGDEGRAFAELLESLRWSRPSQLSLMHAIAGWFQRALNGEPCTIVSPVCPDYAVDPATRHYTFDSLNAGVGRVAQRVLEALPALVRFVARYHLNVRFVVMIGDFEATDATCARVGVTREEFLARLRGSQAAFARAFTTRCPDTALSTPLISEITARIGTTWDSVYQACASAYAAGNKTGELVLSASEFADILALRQSLYKRWHGAGVDAAAVLQSQAPEYGAMACIIEKAYLNPLIFGGDMPSMSSFYQMGTEPGRLRPVFYLRAPNY